MVIRNPFIGPLILKAYVFKKAFNKTLPKDPRKSTASQTDFHSAVKVRRQRDPCTFFGLASSSTGQCRRQDVGLALIDFANFI
jgi:hypothetical protein